MQIGLDCVRIGRLATRAMIAEVDCEPSPGLVSPHSNGAHADMCHETFLKSAAALAPWFPRMAEAGARTADAAETFACIRRLGIDAEKDMHAATNGVNTHRGMLFLLGIGCAAVGWAVRHGMGMEAVPARARAMTSGLVARELHTPARNLHADAKPQSDAETHGERVWRLYGCDGARGEAERGFPTVFHHGLAVWRSHPAMSESARICQTLIGLMTVCDDVNILYRHGPAVLESVREDARRALALGGMDAPEGRACIAAMSDAYALRRISPGGSADLLATTLFFQWSGEWLEKQKGDRSQPCSLGTHSDPPTTSSAEGWPAE